MTILTSSRISLQACVKFNQQDSIFFGIDLEIVDMLIWLFFCSVFFPSQTFVICDLERVKIY